MKLCTRICSLAAAVLFAAAAPAPAQTPKAWEVLASKTNIFTVVGQKKAVITVKAGQVV